MNSKDNFRTYINTLSMDVLIYIFINDFYKFKVIMPFIDNQKLELVYVHLKNLDPMEY